MKSKIVCFIVCFVFTISASAQRSWHVSFSGNNSALGTKTSPLRSISSAAGLVSPGDTVIVHAGTYREWVSPSISGLPRKQIVFQAAQGEKVSVVGSEIVKGWKAIKNGVWKVTLPESFFGGSNPFSELISGDWFFPGNRRLHTGEVYLNGKALYEADSLNQVLSGKPARKAFGISSASVLAPELTWFAIAGKDSTTIYTRFDAIDPANALIEVNVRPACFYPKKTGVNYITVRGFEFKHAATNWAAPTAEQVGAIGTNWSKGWVIENNTVSDSKCAGITLGKDRATGHNPWTANPNLDGAIIYDEMVRTVIQAGWNKENIGSHLVKGNTIYNCGQAGICGSFGGAFSVVENNTIVDVYTRRGWWGAEMAGIKLHGAIDTKIKNNIVRNTNIGIWIDWMAQGTEITGNVCSDNDYVDFFPEVNHGPYLVADNYFLSRFSLKDWSEGGAYLHNYFGGLLSFKPEYRKTPYFKPGTTTLVASVAIAGGDNYFYNNIFAGNGGKGFSPVPNAVIPPDDGIDKKSGYGLAHYEDTVIPVFAGGNVYLAGASPFANEKNSRLVGSLDEVKAGDWKVPQLNLSKTQTKVSGQGWNIVPELMNRSFPGPKSLQQKLTDLQTDSIK